MAVLAYSNSLYPLNSTMLISPSSFLASRESIKPSMNGIFISVSRMSNGSLRKEFQRVAAVGGCLYIQVQSGFPNQKLNALDLGRGVVNHERSIHKRCLLARTPKKN